MGKEVDLPIDAILEAEPTVLGQLERLQDLCDRQRTSGDTLSRDLLEIAVLFPRMVSLFHLLYEELCEYQTREVRESTSRTWRRMICGAGDRKSQRSKP